MEHWETLTHQSPTSTLSRRDASAAGVVVLGCAGVGSAAAINIALTDDLGFFFGLSFVLVAVTCALAAHIRALFAAGILPPLLMVAVVTVVASAVPDAITVQSLADSAGATQRVIAGVIDHATALVVGHLLALAVIGLRIAAAPDRA
ncbi:MAG: DUF6542 domain-containing protein [Nocardioidaceae bacterium]